MNKHGLKTKVGIERKKIEELEGKIAKYESIKPKSPSGEALKQAIRVLVSLGVGYLLSILYSKYPALGQPPEGSIEIVVSILTLLVDKWIYQYKKNRGEVGEGVGIDWIILTLANVMKRRKSPISHIKNE